MRRISVRFVLLFALLVGGFWAPATPSAQAIQQPALQQAINATVKLWTINAQADVIAGCSGSIIHPAGFILTAWHCVGLAPDAKKDPSNQGLKPGDLFHPKGWVVVGPTENPKRVPEPTYVAEVRAGSPELDLAVLKIFRMVDPKQPLPNPLSLPALPLGDSEAVAIKDVVHVLGYPGVGGPLITVTSGTVSGYDDSVGDGTINTFKLDASVSRGHSGGATINDAGQLIGVNSWGASDGADKVDRAIMVHFAHPYLRRVLTAEGLTLAGLGQSGTFGPIRFGTDVVGGKLVGEATVFPSGITKVYAFWAYSGMRDGTAWGRLWLWNGEVDLDKRNADTWQDGPQGNQWYSYYNDDGLEDGVYTLALFINGQEVQRGSFTIGRGAPPRAQTTVISGQVIDANTKQPVANARFEVLQPGVTWEQFEPLATWDDLVLASATTGPDGRFRTQAGVPRGAVYPVAITARGYGTTFFGITRVNVPNDAPAVLEVPAYSIRKD